MTTRSAKGKTMRMHGFVSVCWALANLSCSAYRLARVPKRGYGHVCHALHVVSRSWIYSTCGCFWQPYRPEAVAGCPARGPQGSDRRSRCAREDKMACSSFDEHEQWERRSSIERLVPVSFMHCCTSTPGLSTWSSSTALIGNTRFQVGFPLRCLQRLSRPYIATLLCRWHDNRSTRDMSIPVLSY